MTGIDKRPLLARLRAHQHIGDLQCERCEAAAEIKRLRTALQEIYNIWNGTEYANLCEGACGNLMFGVAMRALEETP